MSSLLADAVKPAVQDLTRHVLKNVGEYGATVAVAAVTSAATSVAVLAASHHKFPERTYNAIQELGTGLLTTTLLLPAIISDAVKGVFADGEKQEKELPGNEQPV